MGPAPSTVASRRLRLPGLLLWCVLALLVGPAVAQESPAPVASATEESRPAPRLVVDSKEIDLGQLTRGESAEADFVLRNEGDAVLRILRAKPG